MFSHFLCVHYLWWSCVHKVYLLISSSPHSGHSESTRNWHSCTQTSIENAFAVFLAKEHGKGSYRGSMCACMVVHGWPSLQALHCDIMWQTIYMFFRPVRNESAEDYDILWWICLIIQPRTRVGRGCDWGFIFFYWTWPLLFLFNENSTIEGLI